MKTFVGFCAAMAGDVLLVNTLGNHLGSHKDTSNPGYNPCLEIIFEDYKKAREYYCKPIKLTVHEDNLNDSVKKGFKRVEFKHCSIVELTEEQIESEIQEHKQIYNWR